MAPMKRKTTDAQLIRYAQQLFNTWLKVQHSDPIKAKELATHFRGIIDTLVQRGYDKMRLLHSFN